MVVIQSFSHVQLFVTPWTAAHQASLSFTVFRSLLKFMSIEQMKKHRLAQGTQPPAAESSCGLLRLQERLLYWLGVELLSPPDHLPPLPRSPAQSLLANSESLWRIYFFLVGPDLGTVVFFPSPRPPLPPPPGRGQFIESSAQITVILPDLLSPMLCDPPPAPDRPNSRHKSPTASMLLPQTRTHDGSLLLFESKLLPGIHNASRSSPVFIFSQLCLYSLLCQHSCLYASSETPTLEKYPGAKKTTQNISGSFVSPFLESCLVFVSQSQ